MPVISETSQADWHLILVILNLEHFHAMFSEAVNTGMVARRARQEIVQVLCTYITAHTIHLTCAGSISMVRCE